MRQNSFEKPVDDGLQDGHVDTGAAMRRNRRDRIGAWLVAISALVCWYQRGNPPSGVNLESSWFDVLTRAFTQGWQWGSDIVFTYGPLGFLTPYLTWNPETASVFRIGQIVLCLLWAAMAFAFACRLGTLRQALLIVAMFAFYPLLVIDIGWNIPFVFAVVLIYRMVDEVPHRVHRTSWYIAMIVLLSLLALIKYTGQVMWIGVMGYATLLGLLRRDFRTALTFGLGGPAIFLAIWLGIGQSISGLGAYYATSMDMSAGYAAMSLQPAPYMDAVGLAIFAIVVAIIVIGFWLSATRRAYVLTAIALLGLSFITWRMGFIRPDDHVVIFFGSAVFVALAALCIPLSHRKNLVAIRWVAFATIAVIAVATSYSLPNFRWGLAGVTDSVSALLHPGDQLRERQSQWADTASKARLPTVRNTIGADSVDVLMNESSVAMINGLNFTPRPVFQGYLANTPRLARANEQYVLDSMHSPAFVLAKIQSIDHRLPTGDDPLSVLAVLRAYIPVDREDGYLVMKKAGWQIAPIPVPSASEWKLASLGSDLEFDQGPKPQVLYFDIQLNFWGKLRSALLREPGMTIDVRLTDGTEQSFSIVRKLGLAGMLVSPFVLDANDWLRWHASIFERRVVSMQLRATDQSEVRWFDPVFAYAFEPVDLPRSNVSALTPELKAALYPGFSPAPSKVVTPREEVVEEGGTKVLFAHAPATLTFDLAPGEWTAQGKFGLLSTAYDCQESDGVALVADRIDAAGTATRLFSRQINPVHNPAERGALVFAFGPFAIQGGERIELRTLPGLAEGAKTDCDWSYLSSVRFDGPVAVGHLPDAGKQRSR